MKKPASGDASGRGEEGGDWVREGLRALREHAPSDESRRATLARLGVDEVAAPVREGSPSARAASASRVRSVLGSLVWGVLLGAVVLVLWRLLG